MKIVPYSKLLLIADSITEAGRDPSGEATPWGQPGTGRGYVSLVEGGLDAIRSENQIRVVSRGTSGHT